MRTLFTLLLLTVSINVWAQVPDSTKKTTPQPVQPIPAVPPPATTVEENIRHVVKLEPILLINGDLPLTYEYFIFRQLSGEIGLGLTFKDYLRSAFDFNDLLSKSPEGKGGEFLNARLGVSFRLGARFYPSKSQKTGSGPYFQAQFQAKSYNWTSVYKGVMVSPNVKQDIEADEKRNFMDFNLIFGKQKIYASNISLDFFGGIGVRSRSVTRHKITDIKNAEDQSFHEFNPESKTDLIPNIVLGVKLGFAF